MDSLYKLRVTSQLTHKQVMLDTFLPESHLALNKLNLMQQKQACTNKCTNKPKGTLTTET